MSAGETLHQFVGAFVDELARSGVTNVCLAPGARSTPLALLMRDHPDVRVWTHLDERSAAFFALGMAKASGSTVAVLSTSGTAAVNFAPAVVEAYYARVPLLVLTADRPPELREAGANQTIDQVRLYGSHVKWFNEMLLPERSPEALRYVRAVACRAAAITRADAAGPVHLNFPIREPLIPTAPDEAPPDNGAGEAASPARPYLNVEEFPRVATPAHLEPLAAALLAAKRGLIVCGPQDDPEFPAAVMRLAEELNAPLLADPLSQVRCGPHHGPLVIDSYDAFLRDDSTAASLEPDIVLRFGATPTSKALLLYLDRHAGARQIVVDGGGGWRDPTLAARDVLHTDPRSLCEALLAAIQSQQPPAQPAMSGWTSRWQEAAQRTRAALESRLAEETKLSEPGVLARLTDMLPAGATLFAGNSMPVRDLDTCLSGGTRPFRFLANRGASGIDGVVSTALGVSAASSEPLVLVIGDLSFFHDMNGLLAARRHGLNATIVLINNDGGGIFSAMPQAAESEHFEELFGTPHGLDVRPVAELYALPHQRVEQPDELGAAVQASIGSPGVSLIEVRTERAANARLHEELWAAVAEAVEPLAAKAAAK